MTKLKLKVSILFSNLRVVLFSAYSQGQNRHTHGAGTTKTTVIPWMIFLMVLLTYCSEKDVMIQNTLKLHPRNNRYFEFRGRPTLLITSAEHYGAVLNADFNQTLYLETLYNEGFNYTRIFVGPYSEMGSDFCGISNNTMSPVTDKWLTPWVKDTATGKFDLEAWNPEFFNRLKSFIAAASEKDIVVEVTLLTSWYIQRHWETSPFYFRNSLQHLDSVPFSHVNTLYNRKLLEYQEKYVRKIVRELNSFPNIFFEIQNEPWSDNPNLAGFANESDNKVYTSDWQKKVELANDVSLEWQRKIASFIIDEENLLPNRHLIAQNICNFGTVIPRPNPAVSIFNFHYALPEAASDNAGLQAVMALDETGFMPHNDFIYRKQAWEFILAGGAVYNNLDYSFIVGKEDGTQPIDDHTPGWGGVAFRKQIRVLKDFIESFDFLSMHAADYIIKEGIPADRIQILVQEGRQYALYLHGITAVTFTLEVPNGAYQAKWINPVTGAVLSTETVHARRGQLQLKTPDFQDDIALTLIKE